MADKIETIQILFQKRNARARGPLNSANYNDNMNELGQDLANFVEQWNNRLTPLTTTLPNEDGTDFIDAFDTGLDGRTLYVNWEATSTFDSRYYSTDNTRPATLYEKLEDIYDAIDTLEEDLESQITAISVSAAQVSIADEGGLYAASNVEQALAEAMDAINNISLGGLDLSAVAQHYLPSTDNTYDIGSPTKRIRDIYAGPSSLRVKSRVGDTASAVDKEYQFAVNTAAGADTGKLEIRDGGAPLIKISSAGVSFPVGITAALNDLTDVDTAGVSTDDALIYNAGTWEAQAIPRAIADQSDAAIASPAAGELLVFNGADWANNTYSFDDLDDVIMTGPTSGQFTRFDGSDWVNITPLLSHFDDVDLTGLGIDDTLVWDGTDFTPRFHVSGLDDLEDLEILTPLSGQFLQYDGTVWKNIVPELSHLDDIDLTGLSVDDALAWDGTDFVPRLLVSGLDDLEDVTIGTPSTGQVLKWSGSTWAPSADTGTTGSGASRRVTFWTSSSELTSDANFTFSSSGYLLVGGTTEVERVTVFGAIALDEITAPSATAGFGKLYYKSDGHLYLLDGSGTETDLLEIPALEGLPDVTISSVVSGDILRHDGSDWKNVYLDILDSAGAAGQLAFWDSTDTLSGHNDLFWDVSSSELGVGTSSPNELLTLDGILSLGEQSSPSNTAGYGKVWYSTSSDLRFMDEGGTEAIVALVDPTAVVASGLVAFFDNDDLLITSSGLSWDAGNQTLAVGNETPNISASIDIGVAAGPLLLPRYTTTQRDAISLVEEGMLIYNTTVTGFQGYAGGTWVNL